MALCTIYCPALLPHSQLQPVQRSYSIFDVIRSRRPPPPLFVLDNNFSPPPLHRVAVLILLLLHLTLFLINEIVIAQENRKFPLIKLIEKALIFLAFLKSQTFHLTDASFPRVADFKAAIRHCTIIQEQHICPQSNTRSNLNSQVILNLLQIA